MNIYEKIDYLKQFMSYEDILLSIVSTGDYWLNNDVIDNQFAGVLDFILSDMVQDIKEGENNDNG
jgi:hypothetical protein